MYQQPTFVFQIKVFLGLDAQSIYILVLIQLVKNSVFGHDKLLPLNGIISQANIGQWGHFSAPNNLTL